MSFIFTVASILGKGIILTIGVVLVIPLVAIVPVVGLDLAGRIYNYLGRKFWVQPPTTIVQ